MPAPSVACSIRARSRQSQGTSGPLAPVSGLGRQPVPPQIWHSGAEVLGIREESNTFFPVSFQTQIGNRKSSKPERASGDACSYNNQWVRTKGLTPLSHF